MTGASPVVDVQNTRTRSSINQDVLQALPVMRSIQDQAQPGAGRRVAQHLGRPDPRRTSTSTRWRRAARPTSASTSTGCATTCCSAPAARRSPAASTSSGRPKWSTTSARSRPRSRSPACAWTRFPRTAATRSPAPGGSSAPTHALQSDNLTDELRAAGIQAVNKLDFNWDTNVAVGGPIKQNKLWFFTRVRAVAVQHPGRERVLPRRPPGRYRRPHQAERHRPADRAGEPARQAVVRLQQLHQPAPSATTSAATDVAGGGAAASNSPLNYSGAVAEMDARPPPAACCSKSASRWRRRPTTGSISRRVGAFDVAKRDSPTGMTTKASGTAPVENFNTAATRWPTSRTSPDRTRSRPA